MTEKLFRWVKAVERLPQIAAHLPVRIEGVYYLAYFEACDMGDYYIFSCFDNHDRRIDTDENRDMIEWLEPYTPSLNAGSLEQAAHEYAIGMVDEQGGTFNHYQDGFLAGAAYVKGGSNITADVMMDVYRTVQVDGSIKEEDKLSTTFRWIYELVQESIKPSRPSLDIDKVVRELREANPYDHLMSAGAWNDCCNKLSEILNAPSQSPQTPIDTEPEEELWDCVWIDWQFSGYAQWREKMQSKFHITRK